MSKQTATFQICGMHCRSCEMLIEEELMQLNGVKKVLVNQQKGTAVVIYKGELDEVAVEQAIQTAGYNLGTDHKPWFSRNVNDYKGVVYCLSFIFVLFTMARMFGLTNINVGGAGSYSSLPIVFLVGITAGLSTCMALVGGLVLGSAARFAEKHPNATPQEKFTPHLFFNFGRVVSFFVLGGVVGWLGSFFQLSTTILGLLTILVGVSMLLIGAQLIRIFPRLNGVHFSLPPALSKALGLQQHKAKEYSHKNAMLLGGMTFFLPCGFTQAMQLFAMSSGSPVTGALTMGVFALGTTPGLLGIGGLTSVVKGAFARNFFQFAGLVVILLALFNISNGLNLAGLGAFIPSFLTNSNQVSAAGADPNVTMVNGVQVVKMTQSDRGYSPNSFTIKKGVPVKWVITSTNAYTCAASIVSQKLNVRKALQEGENVIEFTPQDEGTINFSCSMGMYTGSFTVVSDGTAAGTGTGVPSAYAAAPSQGSSCGGGGGGCGCGGGAKTVAKPLGSPVAAQVQANEQVINATYTLGTDIVPNRFTVKAGAPVRFLVDVKENGSGCMSTITVPGLTQQISQLIQGQKLDFSFTPQQPGTYKITCAMGIPRGEIIVQ